VFKTYALMNGRHIYTLQPWKDPWGRKSSFKFQGFCDGESWKFFATKKDFERDVALQPANLGRRNWEAVYVEQLQTMYGNILLDKLRATLGR
jgi:hypothetical protein